MSNTTNHFGTEDNTAPVTRADEIVAGVSEAVDHAAEVAAKSISARIGGRFGRIAPRPIAEETPSGLDECLARIRRRPIGSVLAAMGFGAIVGFLLGSAPAYFARPQPARWQRVLRRR